MEEMFHPDINDADSNTCTFSCISRCDKNIYYNLNIKSNIEVCMLNRPLNRLSSYEDACSVRELRLENILNMSESESQTTSTMNIDRREREKILERVFNYELSDPVQHFVNKYEQTFGKRSNFLWKWLGVVYGESGVTLSTVDPKCLDAVTDTKILFTMFFSILDDVSEFYKDEKLMESMLAIITNSPNVDDIEKNEKLSLFKELWDHFQKEVSKYPRYNEFKDIFTYDLNQMVNSVRFCYLMNKNPEYINLQEMEIYESYNMIVFLLNGIDLMASPEFDVKDLPHLRTVFWNAQQMARIGNWLSTWKREMKEKDFCSGVVAYALAENIITVDEIKNLNESKIIHKIENSNVVDHFTIAWNKRYQTVKKFKNSIESVDMDKYLSGLETLIKFHLASEGLK